MRDYSKVLARADEVDTCIIRSRWRLRPGTVLTDEPGIYFIPALIEQWKGEGKCRDFINYDKLGAFYDFGGIRLEDDLLITESGNIMLGEGKHIPITVEEVEAYMAEARK
jgi:Xaa-Pro aminopeptidase